MKNFLVYAGNRFFEAQEKALSLGYKYSDSSKEPGFMAVYLWGRESGELSWLKEIPDSPALVALVDFMKWQREFEFVTGQWVVVNDKIQGWKLNIYSHRGANPEFPHMCISGNWSPKAILPYEGNEHLLGTLNDH